MSNLGVYQDMTTLAKKVGGPKKLAFLIFVGGAVTYKGLEVAVKAFVKKYKKVKKDVRSDAMYTVCKEGVSNEGLVFMLGDHFKILEKADDAILIEKVGDKYNPYFVAEDLLIDISDYGSRDSQGE